MAEWPLLTPAGAASLSSSTYPRPKSTRRRRRKATPATLAALGLFTTIPSVPLASASPLPIPFLDFLYPSLRSPAPSSSSTTTAGPSSSTPPSTPVCEAKRTKQSCEGLVRQQRRRTVNERKRRDITTGIKVPVKFEPVEYGWIVAENWDLHGYHRRSDPAALENDTGLEDVQTLDFTDPYGGSYIETTSNLLELPQGWNQSHLARHENYDPVIVSVFAVILVLSILTTIGLCRWRSKKLRKLRDVERTLKEGTEASDSEDDVSEEKRNRKAKDNKKRKSLGKSTAIRRINERLSARIRKRYRSKATATTGGVQEVSPSSGPDNNADTSTDLDPDAESTVRSASIDSRPPGRHASISSRRSVENPHPTPRTSGSPDISRSSSRTRRRTRSIINEPTTLHAAPVEPSVPTVLPPAYPATAHVSISRRSEKSLIAPLRGLEAEYDERDIADYRAALRDRNEGTASAPAIITSEDSQQETVPPFTMSVLEGTSRIAAGATRSAHVATDDKHVLQRLRNMADEPVILDTGDSTHELQAPTFHEVDEWETQRQLEEHGIVTAPREPPESTVEPSTSASASLLPPPPSFAFSSTAMTRDPSSGYSLGPIWSSMNGSSRPSTSRAPSSPPEENCDEAPPPTLVPSAPPQLDDDAPIASAPPAWDNEGHEEIEELMHRPSAPSPSSSSPARSVIVIPPDEDDRRDPPDTELVVGPQNRDTDNDSISSSSNDGEHGTWRTELRTRSRDGRGLPRYEP